MKPLFKNIAIISILSLFFILSKTTPIQAAFDGGTGAVDDPYQISTCVQLQDMEGNLSSHFVLTGNVDCSATSTWNSGAGFVPVGNSYNVEFTGGFDGGGYVIDQLFINLPTTDYVGLFGRINGTDAEFIQSVGLTNIDITGDEHVGGLSGYMSSISIIDVYTTGSVTGANQYVGGLVGELSSASLVKALYSSITVVGASSYTGGLVGRMLSTDMTDCYATGSVSDGTYSSGGLVGGASSASITNSYATGAVGVSSGNFYVGGLLGRGTTSTVSDSFATGSISTDGIYSGGLVGWSGGTTITNGYWDEVRTGQTECYVGGSDNCTAKNTASVPDTNYWFNSTANAPMDQWDFDLIWDTNASDYPTFQSDILTVVASIAVATTDTTPSYIFNSTAVGTITYGGDCSSSTTTAVVGSNYITFNALSTGIHSNCTVTLNGATLSVPTFSIVETFTGGAGTVGDPYEVTSCGQLQIMSENLSAYYELNGNIDCDVAPYNSGEGFTPVGNNTNYFSGGFNGNGYIIDGLYISRSSTNYVGLFGYISGNGTQYIQNVGLTNVDITGLGYVGGLGGDVIKVKVLNTYVTGTVVGTGGYIGGLIGLLDGSTATLDNSYSTATISGTGTLGGLVGYTTNWSVTNNCYATGNVTGSSGSIGGLIGNTHQDSLVTNSYASGNVSGSSNVGGLVGNQTGFAATSNSFAVGIVTSAGDKGGLVGNRDSNAILNTYWNDTGGNSSLDCYFEGNIGCTKVSTTGTGTVDYFKNSSTNGSMSSWSFGSLWKVNASGYPTFYTVILTETTPIDTGTADTTPDYTFRSNTAGTVTYGGDCSSATTSIIAGDNTVTFNTLSLGAHSNCTITFGDSILTLPAFEVYTTAFSGGVGTLGDPYEIFTCSQLQMMKEGLSSFYELASNVDCDVAPYNINLGFTPVGTSSARFSGGFDGNDYIIDGLYINRPTTQYIGLFGYTDGTDIEYIKDVGLANIDIIGKQDVGGLGGYVFDMIVDNAYTTGTIVGSRSIGGDAIGGLVGTLVPRSS